MPRKNKLSRADRALILARAAAGERYAAIARDYGVTGPAIRYLVLRGPVSPPPACPAKGPVDLPSPEARLEAADRALALLAETLGQLGVLATALRRSLATLR